MHIVSAIAIFLGLLFFVIGTPVIANAAADLQLLARDRARCSVVGPEAADWVLAALLYSTKRN